MLRSTTTPLADCRPFHGNPDDSTEDKGTPEIETLDDITLETGQALLGQMLTVPMQNFSDLLLGIGDILFEHLRHGETIRVGDYRLCIDEGDVIGILYATEPEDDDMHLDLSDRDEATILFTIGDLFETTPPVDFGRMLEDIGELDCRRVPKGDRRGYKPGHRENSGPRKPRKRRGHRMPGKDFCGSDISISAHWQSPGIIPGRDGDRWWQPRSIGQRFGTTDGSVATPMLC